MKKLTQQILMTLLLLIVWQGEVMATSQTITLTLNKRLINTSTSFNTTILNQQLTESGITSLNNCTDDFRAISDSLKAWDNRHSNSSNINFIDPTVYEYYYEINIPLPSDPNEKYWVGKQIAGGGGYAFKGVDIFNFKDIKGKIVLQGNHANFKYITDLYFGSWILPYDTAYITDYTNSSIQFYEYNPSAAIKRPTYANAPNNFSRRHENNKIMSNIGKFIYWENCKNIEIYGVNVDGSIYEINGSVNNGYNNGVPPYFNPSGHVGELWGDHGWQCSHFGIQGAISPSYLDSLKNGVAGYTTKAIIKNCNFFQFGADGINIETLNVTIDNSNSYQNCRQGLSWTGGENLTVINSSFYKQGEVLNNSPSAGLDIEPNNVLQANHGKFTNCKFEQNTQYSLINYNGANTDDIEFNNCTFSQKNGRSLLADGHHIKFNSCNFNCLIASVCFTNGSDDETKFNNCDFYDHDILNNSLTNNYYVYDTLIKGIPTVYHKDSSDIILLDATFRKRTLLDNCRFHIDANEPRAFISLSSPYKGLESEYTRVKNCEFIYNQPSLNVDNPTNIFSGVRFSGKNKFISNNPIKNTKIGSYELIFEGGDNNCETNSFLLDGKIEFNHSIVEYDTLNHLVTNNHFILGRKYSGTSLTDDGNMAFAVKNGALVKIFNQVTSDKAILKIGINSNLNIENGGKLIIENQKIEIEGGLNIQKNSSYNVVGTTINKLANSDGKLFIDTLAYNINSSNSLFDFANSINPPCLFGGLQTNNCNPTNYTNIATSNSITFLYNLTQGSINCTKNIEYQPNGFSTSASFKLDGNAIIPINNTIANVPEGMHTLTVIDNGCTTDLEIEVGNDLLKLVSKENIHCTADTNGKISVKVDDNNVYDYSISGSTQQNQTGVFVNLGSGIYTITATNSNTSNCPKTIVVTLSSTICCDANYTTSNNKTVYDNISSWSLGSNNISNQNILVNGTFTIDNNITFDNCHFYFTAGSQIIVNNYNTLTMNNCILQSACGDYWNGINAEDEFSRIVMNNCTVQDMSEGLKISNNATLLAEGNTFVNNATHAIYFRKMNHANYVGKVWNNTFTSNANFIPYDNATVGDVGIEIYNSNYIYIGEKDVVATGNHFSNLHCGIKIRGMNEDFNANGETGLPGNDNQLGIYNNTFEDIRGMAIGSNTDAYANHKGTAVYIDYNLAGGTFAANTKVENKMLHYTIPNYKNCDKGIVCLNSELTSKNLHMMDCYFGVLNAPLWGNKKFDISKNIITNAVLGIQCLGNTELSKIEQNKITTKGKIELNPGQWGPVLYSFGIDLQNFSNLMTNDVRIKDNVVNLSDYAGVGINLQNSGNATQLESNKVNMNYAGADVAMGGNGALNGIKTTASEGAILLRNEVHGNSTLVSTQRSGVAGVLLSNSKNYNMQCNLIENTRFGMMGISDCSTQPNAIQGNMMYNHRMGWVLRHLGTEGTFGDVGTDTTDNDNKFGGDSIYVSKVFKFCDTILADKINTSSTTLDQNQSKSYRETTGQSNTCAYTIQQNFPLISTFNCPSISTGTLSVVDPNYMDLEEAVRIATDVKIYREYEEISRWMDRKKLYDFLVNNPTIRNGNATFLAFYNAMQSDALHQLYEADIKLIDFLDAFTTNNATLIALKQAAALNENNNIDNTRIQEKNEQVINAIYIKLLTEGLDNIGEDDKILIEEMANKCPFQEGSAVYKARTLNAIYYPTQMYDDIDICNTVGVYKINNSGSTKGLFDNENDYLQNVKPDYNNTVLKTNDIKVYPNPADNILNINYNIIENATLIIQDLLGRKVIEINLSNKSNHAMIDVSKLITGVYIYQLSNDKLIMKSDKIIIE